MTSLYDLSLKQQQSAIRRLAEYTQHNGNTNCCEWQRRVDKGGYGIITIDGNKGIRLRVHRLAYEAYYKQSIPPGLCVMHLCDNRKCVNPNHLRVGTLQENIKDRDMKGRQSRGERVYTNKLTSAQVLEIKQLLQEGKLTQPQIAALYNVIDSTINAINTGQNWSHITLEKLSKGRMRGSQHRSAKLTEEQVKTIQQELDNGQLTHRSVAERYNISISLVSHIKSRKIWKHVN